MRCHRVKIQKSWKTSRLKKFKLAIVGFGDVGQRLAKQISHKTSILAFGRNPPESSQFASSVRFLNLDLDRKHALKRLGALPHRCIYLAPPPSEGSADRRVARWLANASTVNQCIYVSTTGVYGSAEGAWVTETTVRSTMQARSKRRIAAEDLLRNSSIPHISILRAPGIYALERLPIQRLLLGTPALIDADDVPTNHIHANDLARLCWLALFKGRNRRAYNAADGQPMMHAKYLEQVAARFNLPTPPRLAAELVQAALSPMAWSMLSGARRVSSARLLREWGIQLKYPSMAQFLDTLRL